MAFSAKCESCGATVLWFQTINGRPMIANPEIDMERGNLRVIGREINHTTVVVEVLKKAEIGQPPLDPDERRYLTHFATCPDSKKWSGAGRSEGV